MLCALLLLGIRAARSLRDGDLSDAERAAIQRAALVTLFTQREQARQILLWSDRAHVAPTLQLLRETHDDSVAASTPALATLSLPIHAETVTLADLEAHFANHPDAWEAWFAKYPASSGIVALTEPVPQPVNADGLTRVMLTVVRTCGEHCHSAWRLYLRRDATGSWRTLSVQPLALRPD